MNTQAIGDHLMAWWFWSTSIVLHASDTGRSRYMCVVISPAVRVRHWMASLCWLTPVELYMH